MKKVYYSQAVDFQDMQKVNKSFKEIEKIFSDIGFQICNTLDIETTDATEIVKSNLNQLYNCDLCVCNITIPNHSYVGCIGELIYAYLWKKTTYVIIGNKLYKDRPWIIYHASKIFESLDEVVLYLQEGDKYGLGKN